MKKTKVKREVSEEIDLLDTMLSSLVELLEEKGIITQGTRKANQRESKNQIDKQK